MLEVEPVTDSTDDDEIEIEIERETRSPTADRSARTDERPPPSDAVDATAPERALEDELGRIDLLTTPDGYVEGRVTGLESVDDRTVRLEVTLPHDEVAVFTLEKPIPWSEQYLLARIVEDVGYDAASIGHLVGESIYLARIDRDTRAGEDAWWTPLTRRAGDAVVASLMGDRYRLEEPHSPEWRLVDPLERPSTGDDDTTAAATRVVAAGLIVLGSLVAAAGAVFGATGGLVVSSAVLGYALPGLVLAWFGLAILLDES